MINFRLKKGEALFESEYKGVKEERYITVEQAEQLAEMLLEWVCFKRKETKIVIAGSKYSEVENGNK